MEITLMVFPKKILFRANGPFRTQNGESSQLSLYSPSGLFCNFTQWKGPREMWKLCFLWKKSYSGQFGYFGSRMVRPHNIGSAISFFLVLHNKRGQRGTWSFISCFSRRNLITSNLIFLGHFLLFDWACSKLSQATATIGFLNSQDMISSMFTTASLNRQDMVRILKHLGHDFLSKRLCDGYYVDVIWYLCVEVNIQQWIHNTKRTPLTLTPKWRWGMRFFKNGCNEAVVVSG